MKKFRTGVILSVFLFSMAAMAATALADEAILVNGDKLTGTIVIVEGGKLTYRRSRMDVFSFISHCYFHGPYLVHNAFKGTLNAPEQQPSTA